MCASGSLSHWQAVHLHQVSKLKEWLLHARRWWQRAEDPWQTLAACMEVRDAVTYPGGASAFPSRLPVQIDGSCNGLQHYAALGRDARGGAAVNLCPAQRPQVCCDLVLPLHAVLVLHCTAVLGLQCPPANNLCQCNPANKLCLWQCHCI